MSGRESRLRTAADAAKALRQYQELKNSGRVARAIIIAELKDGGFQVLGQMLTPAEMAPMLMIAADMLAQAEEGRRIVRMEGHVEPEKRGERVGVTTPTNQRGIRKGPDGSLVPPTGENFISCGECHHPHFHVLNHNNDDGVPARLACSHCGNEIIVHRVVHGMGTA